MIAARLAAAAVALAALAACAPAATGPNRMPALPPDAALAAVRAERVTLPGFQEPNTPAEFNRAVAVRYRAAAGGTPRAAVVLVPGFLGGAANFDRVARAVVASDAALEVWAVDRRSNLLEDHSRLLEAAQSRDPLVAWRYYVRDAGKPGGFRARSAAELRFAGFWGL